MEHDAVSFLTFMLYCFRSSTSILFPVFVIHTKLLSPSYHLHIKMKGLSSMLKFNLKYIASIGSYMAGALLFAPRRNKGNHAVFSNFSWSVSKRSFFWHTFFRSALPCDIVLFYRDAGYALYVGYLESPFFCRASATYVRALKNLREEKKKRLFKITDTKLHLPVSWLLFSNSFCLYAAILNEISTDLLSSYDSGKATTTASSSLVRGSWVQLQPRGQVVGKKTRCWFKFQQFAAPGAQWSTAPALKPACCEVPIYQSRLSFWLQLLNGWLQYTCVYAGCVLTDHNKDDGSK
jgi:hypothetical protein